MYMYNASVFNAVVNIIQNKDIREFAQACIKKLPDYFWTVPASSSGKYHPQYALGDGGLVRHTLALCKFLCYFFEVESIAREFTDREIDLMLVAGMVHDGYKSGKEEDYERSKHTKFNHPIIAANAVREIDGIIPDNEVDFVAHCIESHMGQWNFDKKTMITLPKPEDKYQILVHLADYLASRKDITMELEVAPPTLPEPDDYILEFGKYRGQTLAMVQMIDPGYIDWARENITREPAKSILAKM